MHLLTVLGTGEYKKTCYTWQDKKLETCYVADALCSFFNPEKLIVFVTQESKEKNLEPFREQIGDRATAPLSGDRCQVVDILIPSGKSEAEVWQIFEKVVDSVEANSKIIFDITHAFRSIPMLVLLASAFLKKARNVEIEGVYYGAFEVNKEQPPIFELTPAIKLLDWLTATDKFINTGSAVELGQLLSTIQNDFYRSGKQKEAEIKPTNLLSFGERIQGISRSIELIRPVDLIEETGKLKNLNTAQLEDEVGTFAKPFELLLSQIQADYGQFARANNKEVSPLEDLQKQFLLLRWYVNKKLSSQAILLGREWLVSALCLAEGIDDYRDHKKRKPIEDQLGIMSDYKDNSDSTDNIDNLNQSIARHVSEAKKLADFWSKLSDYRNDIAHAQMRKSKLSAKILENYVEKNLIQELSALLPQYTSAE